MKSIPALLKRAQTVFNSFVRERDKGKPCISCQPGKPEQAGHYVSVGRSSYLRFNEMNVNGQCEQCNCMMYGNEKNYREGMIKKYGEYAVLKLEQDARRVSKWDREQLQNIIDTYKS